MKNVPENSLQTSLSWWHFKTRQAVKKTWSKSLKSSFLAKSFSFSTKRKLSILLNFPFLSASSNSTRLILLREKGSLRSHGRWFAFMKKNRHAKITQLILLHEKFLQFGWLRAVAFHLNLKYLHNNSMIIIIA